MVGNNAYDSDPLEENCWNNIGSFCVRRIAKAAKPQPYKMDGSISAIKAAGCVSDSGPGCTISAASRPDGIGIWKTTQVGCKSVL